MRDYDRANVEYILCVLRERYSHSDDKDLVDFLRYNMQDILEELDTMEDTQLEIERLYQLVMTLEDNYASLKDDVDELRDDLDNVIDGMEDIDD